MNTQEFNAAVINAIDNIQALETATSETMRQQWTSAFRAMLMAMSQQESMTAAGPTKLATDYHNIYGMHGTTDKPHVILGANQFENEDQIYRTYEKFEDSISSALYLIRRSSHYELARTSAAQAILPYGNKLRFTRDVEWCKAWILTAAKTWCSSNKHHGEEVLNLFYKWLNKV